MRRVHRALRAGEPYEQETFDKFMLHHAKLIQETFPMIRKVCESSPLIESEDDSTIRPNHGRYVLSARPKALRSTIGKLRRMPDTPLVRIQDIAGLRVDFDGSLAIQDSLAERLRFEFESAGAKTVKMIDLREEPHAGYRAVHLM